MYKTVRHGENSLQYTILPQQDDSSVASGNASSCRRVPQRSSKTRTTTILIITLIVACSIVGSAVLVPLLVSADIVTLPSALQRFTGSPNGKQHVIRIQHVALGSRKLHHDNSWNTTTATTLHSNTPDLTTSQQNLNTVTTVANESGSKSPPVVYPAEVSLRTPASESHKVEDVTRPLNDSISVTWKPLISQAAITPFTTQTSSSDSQLLAATIENDVIQKRVLHTSTLRASANNQSDKDTTSKQASEESISNCISGKKNTTCNNQRPSVEVKAASDVTSRVLIKPSGASSDSQQSLWLHSRWLADPSSYLRWTGYNGRENFLLPLLLAALTAVLLISICACYVIRRQRQKSQRRRTIGKISSDLQRGDKATLLPDGSEEE